MTIKVLNVLVKEGYFKCEYAEILTIEMLEVFHFAGGYLIGLSWGGQKQRRKLPSTIQSKRLQN
eukprot:2480894-Amphidinium_carterae.1